MKDVCNIIQDLLPLYSDDVCSEDSRNLVEEHVVECEACQNFLEKLKKEEACDGVESDHIKELKKIQGQWKKGRKKALVKGIVIATCICAILGGVFYKIASTDIPIPTEKMKVSELCQLSNGWYSYHLEVEDDKYLNGMQIYYDGFTEEMYLTPHRTVWESERTKAIEDLSEYHQLYDHYLYFKVSDMNSSFGGNIDFMSIGSDVKKIYLGTEEDRILIWERGMTVPAASEEMETRYKAKILDMQDKKLE